uniref:Uncharacterized protein n=1 Tax=Myoviridae sp. ct4uh47 TaxID=2825032 RepID=A0A8S5V5Y4_9CAUD|nr:MAG TPA: hypothetical protein [Myoviridae sp. ct4uh47]
MRSPAEQSTKTATVFKSARIHLMTLIECSAGLFS